MTNSMPPPPPVVLTGLVALDTEHILVRASARDAAGPGVSPSVLVPWTRSGAGQPILIDRGVTSQCLMPGVEDGSFALGFDGTLFSIIGGKVDVSTALPPGVEPNSRCWLFSIRAVGRNVYCVGMLRNIYRLGTNGSWENFNQGAEPNDEDDLSVGFRDIDGIAPNRLTCVGLGGEIWHYEGQSWIRADSPTNMRLDAVRQLDGDNVIACGAKGTIVRGYGNLWKYVDTENVKQDLVSIEVFGGKTFIASRSTIYEMTGNRLQPVNMGINRKLSVGYLSAAGGSLWSVGNSDVVVFDGNTWTEVPSPFHK
jgi:hypothetical protein